MTASAPRARRRRNPLLLPALAVALLIYFLWTYLETGSPPTFEYSGIKRPERIPEFYFEQVDSQHFDRNGDLKLDIHGESIVQQPQDGSARVSRPRATLYQQRKASWTLQSESAIVWPGAEQVDLQQAVRIRSADGQTTLSSETIRVFPREQRVSTDQPVTVNNANGKLQATGLNADLNQRRFELLDNVRGLYFAKP